MLFSATLGLVGGCGDEGTSLLNAVPLTGHGNPAALGSFVGESVNVEGRFGVATLLVGERGEPAYLRLSLSGERPYQVLDLGPADTGDLWEVRVLEPAGPHDLAIFDGQLNLLARAETAASGVVQHVVRRETGSLRVGVALAGAVVAETVELEVRRTRRAPAPGPVRQVVWLNFHGVEGLTISDHAGLSFGAVDAAALGMAYAGQTDALRRAIRDRVKACFAEFEIDVYTSQEGFPPTARFSTIHFGGSDPELLGLAENIDPGNEDVVQHAVVFLENFAVYATNMELTVEELGGMIGNVASHELGHLLGLHHTRQPRSVMDVSAADAWDLVAMRDFKRAELDPAVFPVGWQDAAGILACTVGTREPAMAAVRKATLQQEHYRREAGLVPMLHRLCACSSDR